MNKNLETLYNSLLEKDALYTKEATHAFTVLCSAITKGKSFEEKEKIFEMLGNYEEVIESNAFKVGFYTAVELLTNK